MKDSKQEVNLAVSYKKFKKMVAGLNKVKFKDDDMVSFEYIVGSCFPTVYDNIKTRIREAYTQGYIDGQKDKKETTEHLN